MANLPEFRVYLEKTPAGWDTLAESFKEKMRYDDAVKKLILTGRLTEVEKKALRDLSPLDEAYQDAIEYLFWKSNSPPDTLERKELEDKDFVTEKLTRMNPWVHRTLAVWLVIIGIGSVITLIGLWPNLKDSADQLNKYLETPDFYDTVHIQKPDFVFSEEAKLLINETTQYRTKPFSELQDDKKHNIKKLNQLLLQEVYSKTTLGMLNKSCPMNWLYGTGDQVMFILAFLAGIIGSATHGISSLMDFRGNRRLFRSWSLWYFALPIVGGMVAIIFYITVRAGFIAGNNGTENINPFGIAAVSVMVGLFTDKATTKLAEVFDTMFKTTTKAREGALDTSGAKENAKT